MPRLVTALLTIILALCAYAAAIHWSDDRHPLMIDAQGCSPPVRLPNPCDSTNCNRPNTRLFA